MRDWILKDSANTYREGDQPDSENSLVVSDDSAG